MDTDYSSDDSFIETCEYCSQDIGNDGKYLIEKVDGESIQYDFCSKQCLVAFLLQDDEVNNIINDLQNLTYTRSNTYTTTKIDSASRSY